MYGVLYAISPELFPTKDRGTGSALVATANRIFGIMVSSPVIYVRLSTRLTHPGPNHRSVRKPHDICANLDFGSHFHCLWFHCSFVTV